uniref:Uncharacterized protein n=1 Tax=Molossus molossus TaxID=27622 RepID=A0A7J8JXF9_MOLMO|nr:hypothetical protein HJG59_008011 [Molossus molossus]
MWVHGCDQLTPQQWLPISEEITVFTVRYRIWTPLTVPTPLLYIHTVPGTLASRFSLNMQVNLHLRSSVPFSCLECLASKMSLLARNHYFQVFAQISPSHRYGRPCLALQPVSLSDSHPLSPCSSFVHGLYYLPEF